MKPYLEEKEAVLTQTGSSMAGLTDAEASERLKRNGPNKLKEGKKDSLLVKFLGELKDPMTIVLIVAAIVSAVTALYAGESLTDTVIILADHARRTDDIDRAQTEGLLADARAKLASLDPDDNRSAYWSQKVKWWTMLLGYAES